MLSLLHILALRGRFGISDFSYFILDIVEKLKQSIQKCFPSILAIQVLYIVIPVKRIMPKII